MNKWQKTIEELLTVFKTGGELTASVNEILGDGNRTTHATISRIKSGVNTKVEHDIGQALLILHVRYIPIKNRLAQGVVDEVSTSS